jgi:hypothetical protein
MTRLKSASDIVQTKNRHWFLWKVMVGMDVRLAVKSQWFIFHVRYVSVNLYVSF